MGEEKWERKGEGVMIILVSHVIMQPHPLSLHATANGAHELDAPSEQGEHNAAVGGIPS